MEVTVEFEVALPLDAAWAVLSDLEWVVTSWPGAEGSPAEEAGEGYAGSLKMHYGSATVNYKGTLGVESADTEAHRAVLRVDARESRRKAGVSGTLACTLEERGPATLVKVNGALEATGNLSHGDDTLMEAWQQSLAEFVANLQQLAAPAGTDEKDRKAEEEQAMEDEIAAGGAEESARADAPETGAADAPETGAAEEAETGAAEEAETEAAEEAETEAAELEAAGASSEAEALVAETLATEAAADAAAAAALSDESASDDGIDVFVEEEGGETIVIVELGEESGEIADIAEAAAEAIGEAAGEQAAAEVEAELTESLGEQAAADVAEAIGDEVALEVTEIVAEELAEQLAEAAVEELVEAAAAQLAVEDLAGAISEAESAELLAEAAAAAAGGNASNGNGHESEERATGVTGTGTGKTGTSARMESEAGDRPQPIDLGSPATRSPRCTAPHSLRRRRRWLADTACAHLCLEAPPGVTPEDRAAVARLLGRVPRGAYEIVVRAAGGLPVVIRNSPLLDDGTPMPTRYWLLAGPESVAVGRLEAAGGVRQAESELDPSAVAAAHAAYAAERDAQLPAAHDGPRPEGGVGGTRQGVKCLHAHLAWYLAGGKDPVGAWTAERLGLDRQAYRFADLSETGRPVAAIDCGTNSTRLLIADAAGNTIDRQMTITRLGQGVDDTGLLDPAAIDRTVAVLRQYRAAMDSHGVGAVMASATSAARDAGNASEFLTAAAAALGTTPEVLGGKREGELSFRGATAGLDPDGGPYLVVDVGGGSTEIVASEAGTIDAVSLDVGCVRVTERWLKSDPPSPAEMRQAVAHIEGSLEECGAGRFRAARRMVGLAGTVSALTMVSLGLSSYEREAVHGATLSRADVERLLAAVAQATVAERRAMPGMEEARADVIVGGSLVLATVMSWLGFFELLVSESDILDGMVAELLGADSGLRN